MFTFGLAPPSRLSWAGARAGVSRVYYVPRYCVWRLPACGLADLTCGRDRNMATFAQVNPYVKGSPAPHLRKTRGRLPDNREGRSGEAGEHGAKGDLGLQAGQGKPPGSSGCRSRRRVAAGVAAEVEAVGIPVGGADRHEHPLTRRDHHVADGHVLRGEPVGRVVQGVREPEQLLRPRTPRPRSQDHHRRTR